MTIALAVTGLIAVIGFLMFVMRNARKSGEDAHRADVAEARVEEAKHVIEKQTEVAAIVNRDVSTDAVVDRLSDGKF